MKHKLILFVVVYTISFGFFAQHNDTLYTDYLVDVNDDTTYCYISDVWRSGGRVFQINYIDINNKNYTIKSLSDCERFKTISVNDYILDFIPFNPRKPNGHHRHIYRKVDGEVKIYDHMRVIAKMESGGRKMYSVVGAGSTVYTIKVASNYYKITNGNIKKYVAPYLLEDGDFKKKFKSPINKSNIEMAVKVYNGLQRD